jgi:predicted transcriptional regulator
MLNPWSGVKSAYSSLALKTDAQADNLPTRGGYQRHAAPDLASRGRVASDFDHTWVCQISATRARTPGRVEAGDYLPSDVRLYIMNRTQIYLDESQTTRLDERATAEGTSRSTVIRRAVDAYLAQEVRDAAAWKKQWRQALEGSAGRAPYLDDGSDYVEGIRRVDADRLSRLAR